MHVWFIFLCCSHDPHFNKALQGIENLQKLASSDLEDTASLGGGSELEDEGEDILVAGGLEDALEVHALCVYVQYVPGWCCSIQLLMWH